MVSELPESRGSRGWEWKELQDHGMMMGLTGLKKQANKSGSAQQLKDNTH